MEAQLSSKIAKPRRKKRIFIAPFIKVLLIAKIAPFVFLRSKKDDGYDNSNNSRTKRSLIWHWFSKELEIPNARRTWQTIRFYYKENQISHENMLYDAIQVLDKNCTITIPIEDIDPNNFSLLNNKRQQAMHQFINVFNELRKHKTKPYDMLVLHDKTLWLKFEDEDSDVKEKLCQLQVKKEDIKLEKGNVKIEKRPKNKKYVITVNEDEDCAMYEEAIEIVQIDDDASENDDKGKDEHNSWDIYMENNCTNKQVKNNYYPLGTRVTFGGVSLTTHNSYNPFVPLIPE